MTGRLLPAPQVTIVSVPGALLPVETETAAENVWPASVDRRNRMSFAVAPLRSAQLTLTSPFGPTVTLHPNGAVPPGARICSFT
jgi:hypothetical protein